MIVKWMVMKELNDRPPRKMRCDKKMMMSKTVRSDRRPLAQQRTAAVRRRQEDVHAADRVMTTTEAQSDQLGAF